MQLSYQSLSCCVSHVLCMFLQDKRAHLNDHIEASVEDHLELTWSSLVAAKQELDNMKDLRQKFHEIQKVNQKLTESVADSREEVRDLTLTVKSLEIQNIQLKKWMEDMARKTAKGTLTESVADTRKEVRALKLAMQNLEMQNIQQKRSMEGMARKMEFEMKSLEMQAKATRACERAQFGSLQKSFPTLPMMPASSSALTGMYASPREESRKVQAIPESALTGIYVSPREESKRVQAIPELALTGMYVSPREESKKVQAIPGSALTGMYVWPREESKKVQATPESNLNASFTLKD